MEEKVLLNATLCFLRRDSEILLARKANKIGAGCWNGYGGGIEEGETPEIATIRELEEEAAVYGAPEELQKIAVVDFHNTKTDGEQFTCRVHVYTLSEWEGMPQETEEMLTPTWFPIAELPIDEMMLADAAWLPAALRDRTIYAEAWYGPRQHSLLRPVKISELRVL